LQKYPSPATVLNPDVLTVCHEVPPVISSVSPDNVAPLNFNVPPNGIEVTVDDSSANLISAFVNELFAKFEIVFDEPLIVLFVNVCVSVVVTNVDGSVMC